MAKHARVSAVMFGGAGASEDQVGANVNAARALLDRAAEDQPDLVILPECFNALGLRGRPLSSTAEPIDGPTVKALAEKAREYNMYVVCPIYTRVGEATHNSSILIDRTGATVGAYHKMWPTIGEIEEGVTPGSEAFVAETDFGKVGFAICFDLNYRPVGEGNEAGGARLVAFSSMYRGGISTRIWAYDFGVYLASSTPSEMSHFCDPLGRVLGDLWTYQPVITRDVNLDFEICHIDYNNAKWADIRRQLGKRVTLDILGPEGIFMLVSEDPEVSAHDIMEMFELEPRRDYFRRSTERRAEALFGGQTKQP